MNSELEFDLQRAREDLQSTLEEMHTSQEELQSTNEEMQSTNEELQSTNEELTTSKEEMQSMNEELHTLNAELQSKIDDSDRVNNDMNNLLNSIDIATLFLDKYLRIRQFTHPATKIFKLIHGDIGRPFTDQVTELDYPELYNDAQEVLRTLIPIEKLVSTHDARWFKVRIMPYRTSDDKIDGMVITFIDITESKQLENILKHSQMTLRSFIHTVPAVIVSLSSTGKVIEFNAEAEKLFECNREEVMGEKFVELFIPPERRKEVEEQMKKILSGGLPNEFVTIIKTHQGAELKIEWSAHQLLDEHGQLSGIIAIGINILHHE